MMKTERAKQEVLEIKLDNVSAKVCIHLYAPMKSKCKTTRRKNLWQG